MRKCRSSAALCGYCGGLIRRGELEGLLDGAWQHVACVRKQQLAEPEPAAEMSWSEVYRVTEPGDDARKLAFARYLREHGKPVGR